MNKTNKDKIFTNELLINKYSEMEFEYNMR